MSIGEYLVDVLNREDLAKLLDNLIYSEEKLFYEMLTRLEEEFPNYEWNKNTWKDSILQLSNDISNGNYTLDDELLTHEITEEQYNEYQRLKNFKKFIQ